MTTWLLLGLGLLLVPARASDLRVGSRPRRQMSLRALQILAAGASGLAAFVLAGGPGAVIAGAAAASLAWWLVARLHARPDRLPPDPALPGALDLVAAVLRAGRPLSAALLLAAPAAGPHHRAALQRVGRLLALGADAVDAWQPVAADPVLGDLAATARRSADSGIRLAAAFDRAAVQVRAAQRSAAQARAHRAGALAVAPLGLCFLPAFVCLGIVPVVVGIARTALAG